MIEKLNKEHGITIVMISHDVRAAIQFANKVLYIGNDIFFGTREEYLKHSAMESVREREGNDGNI